MNRNRLYGVPLKLALLMSDISEHVYSASWLIGTEWILWRALLEWRRSGRAYWSPGAEYPSEITEHMRELDRLQREAGGWVWWLDGEAFVPEARWLALVQRRNEMHLPPKNEDLDSVVPATAAPQPDGYDCPKGHGRLVLRPLDRQTTEQRWCGTWYDCGSCNLSLLVQSPELRAQLAEQARSSIARALRAEAESWEDRGSLRSHPGTVRGALRRRAELAKAGPVADGLRAEAERWPETGPMLAWSEVHDTLLRHADELLNT